MLSLACAEVLIRSRNDGQAEETDQKRDKGVNAQTPAEIPRRPVTRAAQLQNLLILILDHAFS